MRNNLSALVEAKALVAEYERGLVTEEQFWAMCAESNDNEGIAYGLLGPSTNEELP